MKAKAQKTACVILAAGKGTRMRSTLPKVMHQVAGKPMLMHVVDMALSCDADKVVVVISPEMETVRKELQKRYAVSVASVIQKRQLGTGDAVKAARQELKGFKGNVVVLYGDTPLVERETVLSVLHALEVSAKAGLAVVGMEVAAQNAYGRLVTDKKGRVERIVEVKDATPKEKNITLCNSGIMAVKGTLLPDFLEQLENKNASGEYYLTDLVRIARAQGHECSLVLADAGTLSGVNSRSELAAAEAMAQWRFRKQAMDNGVTLIDPASVYFSADTVLGRDTVVYPNVFFGTGVESGDNVEIRPFCHIEGAKIGKGAVIGPFARLRPGTEVGEAAHVGNFVELKKTKLGKGSKANHLSYIGDAQVGENSNIGAGVITCNYDGFNKYATRIGDHAFIGSNTALVAPVHIGDGAIVGAGSVITEDVSKDSLAIARGRQQEKPGWARKFRKQH